MRRRFAAMRKRRRLRRRWFLTEKTVSFGWMQRLAETRPRICLRPAASLGVRQSAFPESPATLGLASCSCNPPSAPTSAAGPTPNPAKDDGHSRHFPKPLRVPMVINDNKECLLR